MRRLFTRDPIGFVLGALLALVSVVTAIVTIWNIAHPVVPA